MPRPLSPVRLAFVRVCAALIGLRSLTNFAKLFQGSDAVLVFCGTILHGSAAALPAFAVGLFMLVTAIAMWRPARWAVSLIGVYAAYVLVNLALWTFTHPEELERVGARISSATDPAALRRLGSAAMAVYAAVAIVTTAVPAWILWKQRAAD